MKRSPLKRKSPLKQHSSLKSSSNKKRSTYTRSLREYIRERDGFKCQVCGCEGTQIHHCIPRGRFYSSWYTFSDVNDERNLMLICNRCHQGAHNKSGELERIINIQERRFGPLRKSQTLLASGQAIRT